MLSEQQESSRLSSASSSLPQARARPLRLYCGEGVRVHGDIERHPSPWHHDARAADANRYHPHNPNFPHINMCLDFWIASKIHTCRQPILARSQKHAQVPVAQHLLHPGLLQLRGRWQLRG